MTQERLRELISSGCPPGLYCMGETCDYLSDKDSLYAKGRDYESNLCGLCQDGYSEAINSSACVKCYGSHLLYLLVPAVFAMIISLFLIVVNAERVRNRDRKSKEKEKEVPTATERII